MTNRQPVAYHSKLREIYQTYKKINEEFEKKEKLINSIIFAIFLFLIGATIGFYWTYKATSRMYESRIKVLQEQIIEMQNSEMKEYKQPKVYFL